MDARSIVLEELSKWSGMPIGQLTDNLELGDAVGDIQPLLAQVKVPMTLSAVNTIGQVIEQIERKQNGTWEVGALESQIAERLAVPDEQRQQLKKRTDQN